MSETPANTVYKYICDMHRKMEEQFQDVHNIEMSKGTYDYLYSSMQVQEINTPYGKLTVVIDNRIPYGHLQLVNANSSKTE